ncbi:MAG: MATE family efflux transporter [Synechococcales cyanobacterium M58_A2018_015]|nr:MATE family efflux transporter [Synechococcales cyanobacterium M58_A2018_015]
MHHSRLKTLLKTKLLTEIRACLELALPLAGAQLAQSATGFVDTVMMGLLGSAVLAAGGLGATLFTALLISTSSVVSAVSPLVATAYGAGQTQQVGRIAHQGLWLAGGLAVLQLLGLGAAGPLLRLLGQEDETIALALPYLQAMMWGVPAALGFAVLRNWVTALSDARPVIVIMVCGTGLNIVGNYVLIFGKLGLPALGLAGIGWASASSFWSMFFALIVYILSQPRYRSYRVLHGLPQIDPYIFRELLQIGLPIGVLAVVETGMFTITTFLMGQLGTVTLAAHQVALQTAAITFMVPLGISFATTVRVGQQMGQANPLGARLAGSVGIGMAAGFMAIMALLFWLLPQPIVALYLDVENPENQQVVSLAKTLLGVAAVFQLFDGIQVSAAGALRGLKDTRIPMLIGMLSYWGIGLTSGYLLGLRLGWGGVGLWWGLAFGLATAAIVLTWRFGVAPLTQD